MKHNLKWFWVLAACLALIPISAVADDFRDYNTSAGTTAVVDLPTVTNGYFVAVDTFPDETAELIDGQFEAEGRMIAANGSNIYLQRTYGSSEWDVVGTVSGTMEPSFIHVSPDGSKIALGIGYGAPLLIIPTSVLSAATPPELDSHASVKSFENVSYYDGDWVDNQYFVINGGAWPGPECTYPYHNDPDCVFESGVGSIDTDSTDPANHTGVLVITNIPGASSDVEVDGNGNLLTGLGWATGPPNRTGELKVWATDDWDPAAPQTLDYEATTGTTGKLVAKNILSVAYLGEDAEGNMHVGGGDAFGSGGTDENGYAALIKAGVVNDIATGSRTTPVNDGNKVDNSEYKFFAPDPCQDDSATGILADTWGRGLAVMWNPTYYETNGTCYGSAGSASDYWAVGVTPRLTIYYPGSAPDSDGDGIPDTADNAYLSYNPGQEDTDGDGYGDVTDADYDNDDDVDLQDYIDFRSHFGATGPQSDFDADGDVDLQDYIDFRGKFNTEPPWY